MSITAVPATTYDVSSKVDMPRDRAARLQLVDHEPGVHGTLVLTHCRAGGSRRRASPAGSRSDKLNRTGRAYDVASAHWRFSAVAARR